MKQIKTKSHRNLLAQEFKEKCKEIIKQEPRNYLVSSFKDHHLSLDISLFSPEDIPFFHIMLTLPIHKLTILTPDPNIEKSPSKNKNKDTQTIQTKTFPQTAKFRQFMAYIGEAMETNASLRTVKIQRVPLSVRFLKQINEGLTKTTSLRELELIECGLTDDHLESIKVALAANQSLMTLNLSKNNLCNIGGMIGHILCQHSRRRNEIVFYLNIRGEAPADDLSNSGLCEVNLQSNQINDKAVIELATFLKSDSWTKCLNLRHNSIKNEGVKELALMLKVNNSLISLDLRGNEGLSREYSRYIYKKLVLNMEKYKQQKEFYQKCKEPSLIPESQERTPPKQKEMEQSSELAMKYKTVKDKNFYGRYDSKEYTTIAEPPTQNQKNNMTLDRKIKKVPKENKVVQIECPNCKTKTFEMLRLEKKNLDLQLQLRKVKHTLLTKNVDVSAIQLNSSNQTSVIEWLSNRSNNENDEELLQRMEQIMLELTRVIETIEQHQNTNVHTTNPLDNPNSFSNTIQLYQKNSHLQDLSKEIQEDRLQSVLEGGGSLEACIQENSSG